MASFLTVELVELAAMVEAPDALVGALVAPEAVLEMGGLVARRQSAVTAMWC